MRNLVLRIKRFRTKLDKTILEQNKIISHLLLTENQNMSKKFCLKFNFSTKHHTSKNIKRKEKEIKLF